MKPLIVKNFMLLIIYIKYESGLGRVLHLRGRGEIVGRIISKI